ncbi:MAG: hypothetical protein ACPGJS_13355 [Flammeovirgaceae bacterium]
MKQPYAILLVMCLLIGSFSVNTQIKKGAWTIEANALPLEKPIDYSWTNQSVKTSDRQPIHRVGTTAYYAARLTQLDKINRCQNFQELYASCDPSDGVDMSLPFRSEKKRIMKKIEREITLNAPLSIKKQLFRQKMQQAKQSFRQASKSLKW